MIWRRSLAVMAAVTTVLGLGIGAGGCGSKRKPEIASAVGRGGRGAAPPVATAPTTQGEPVDSGPDIQPLGAEAPGGSDFTPSDATTGEGGPLEDIHFDYDQASLSEQARSTLEKHAVWLQSHRDAKVVVEGHCDERGTVEYNLALGDQRARAAHDYLVSLGVGADRLKVVSFGKERPLDLGHDESAWQRNRRAHFQVGR